MMTRSPAPQLPPDARTIVVVDAPEADAPTTFARGSVPAIPPSQPPAPYVARGRMLKHTPPPSVGMIPSFAEEQKTTVAIVEPKTTVAIRPAVEQAQPAQAPQAKPAPAPQAAPQQAAPQQGQQGAKAAQKPAQGRPPFRAASLQAALGLAPVAKPAGQPQHAKPGQPQQANPAGQPAAAQPGQPAVKLAGQPAAAQPGQPAAKPAGQPQAKPGQPQKLQTQQGAKPAGQPQQAKPAPGQPAAKPAGQPAAAKPAGQQKPAQGAKPAGQPQNPAQQGAKPAGQPQPKPAAAQPAAAKPAQPAAAQPAAAAAPAASLAQQAAKQPVAAPAPVEPPQPTAAIPIGAPIAIPDELFALIRRIALQVDLTNAAGVLAAGLGELLGARVVMALVGETGQITSPQATELKAALGIVRLDAIQACHERRQVLASERCVLIPFAAQTPAVLVVWRPATQPVLEQPTIMLAVAAATRLGVVDHFMARHGEQQRQSAADQKSMFRPEALSAARQKNREGALVALSPKWVKIALPAIILIAAALVTVAAIVHVPTYSRGTLVVTMDGRKNVISTVQGAITSVYVIPGQRVKAGDPLMALDTQNEKQQFEAIDTNYRDQLAAYLVDPTDDNARAALVQIAPQRNAALQAIAQKTIVAGEDGVIGAILATDIVSGGEQVLTILPADSQPSITAFMPGTDRARIKPGMVLQVEMSGYYGERQHVVVTEVGEEIIGPSQARKLLGQKLGDTVMLPPSIVVVKAKLASSTFTSKGKTFNYFDGMDGLGEIEVDTKSFLATVVPTGDN